MLQDKILTPKNFSPIKLMNLVTFRMSALHCRVVRCTEPAGREQSIRPQSPRLAPPPPGCSPWPPQSAGSWSGQVQSRVSAMFLTNPDPNTKDQNLTKIPSQTFYLTKENFTQTCL